MSSDNIELPVGPPCPLCKIKTSFMGVRQSIRSAACVEVYMCLQHFTLYESQVRCNKDDEDYKNGCETYI